MIKRSFPHYTQLDAMDCGPSCLRMIAKYYGKTYTLQTLRERSFLTREGVTMLGISDAAESIGLRTTGVRITFERLMKERPFPCILHWNQQHFVVCYDIKKKKKGYSVYISDPGSERLCYEEDEFKRCWLSTRAHDHDMGTALLLEPGPDFYDEEGEEEQKSVKGLMYFTRYLRPYRKVIIQLMLGMVVLSMLQLVAPFLTQAMVDLGIQHHNLNLITLILGAQLVIFLSQMSVGMIRSWLMLHMNTRINISLISDFLAKLMKLPLSFFDTKMVGDIVQRIGDHGRIESFLTGASINTLFSIVNFFVFAFVLACYDTTILTVFLIGNVCNIVWIQSFMHYRRKLDIKRFNQAASEQSNLFQLITGMQDIKLNNSERQKRWEWERIQVKQFKISVKGLAIGQYQQIGSVFFSQLTNITITYMAARAVVMGDITLGMMMSLSYIIGQLSGPINDAISFILSFQYAKISLERLSEIHQQDDEERKIILKRQDLPEDRTLNLKNVSFSYSGAERHYVLKGLNLVIPAHKVTAVVGASGSGKTTLIKLLLGFYEPQEGTIKVGNTLLKNINPHVWRSRAGSVMQEGYLFSDTIARNIALGEETIDKERLYKAATIANIRDFIEESPIGYDTKIGMEGTGVSQGQKQRLLIARAVYKDPEYIFLDEATNSLDANNEKEIIEHLQEFYRGRTVVIVAHRLSTVKHADHIVVMDKGQIIEEGNHQDLTNKKGAYYQLVKNQLELGN